MTAWIFPSRAASVEANRDANAGAKVLCSWGRWTAARKAGRAARIPLYFGQPETQCRSPELNWDDMYRFNIVGAERGCVGGIGRGGSWCCRRDEELNTLLRDTGFPGASPPHFVKLLLHTRGTSLDHDSLHYSHEWLYDITSWTISFTNIQHTRTASFELS